MTDMEAKALELREEFIRAVTFKDEIPVLLKALTEAHREGMERGRIDEAQKCVAHEATAIRMGMEKAAKMRIPMPSGISGEDSEWLWDLAQDEMGEAIHKETTDATT